LVPEAVVTFTLPASAYPPLAVGFFGLGVGYLIYGPGELFGFPGRGRAADIATGVWGFWMPGFMQFITGVYLFVGLVWFNTFRQPPLYMAALAFTAFGVHWFAIGLNRALGGDPRANALMSVPFTMISTLGIVVFVIAGDYPVALVFLGLALVYISELFASLRSSLAERALGSVRILTGVWLMYLTWAVALNLSSGFKLWV
jgi:hypothetical protein